MRTAYLIQPYSCDPDQAYLFALSLLAREVQYDSNVTMISPIILYHQAAKRFNLPHTFNFWIKHNFQLISRCDEVRVVCADGLDDSVGCSAEIEFARQCNITCRYYVIHNNIVSDRMDPRPPVSYVKLMELLRIERENWGR